MAIEGFYDTDCIENFVEKSEIAHFKQFHFLIKMSKIAHFEQFHLFSQCFPTAFFLQAVKMSIYGGKGYIRL